MSKVVDLFPSTEGISVDYVFDYLKENKENILDIIALVKTKEGLFLAGSNVEFETKSALCKLLEHDIQMDILSTYEEREI